MSSSATANALRTLSRRAAPRARFASTQASSSSSNTAPSQEKLNVQPKDTLPASKMRVLVDLYHESATFITKENLSTEIDEAFIYRKSKLATAAQEASFQALASTLVRTRGQAKFGQSSGARTTTNAPPADKNDTWSDRRSLRARAAMSTLYGVYDRKLPGYDALMDEVGGRNAEVRERAVRHAEERAKAAAEKAKAAEEAAARAEAVETEQVASKDA